MWMVWVLGALHLGCTIWLFCLMVRDDRREQRLMSVSDKAVNLWMSATHNNPALCDALWEVRN